MKTPNTRREFLSQVGQGMIVATVGHAVSTEMGLANLHAADSGVKALAFGKLESLVCLMQETPVSRLLPTLAEKLKAGTTLHELTAAGALANARTFGGEDYIGFHTMMALSPALHMSSEMPAAQRALPVFKVLYRNTNRIQEKGGRTAEVLHPVPEEAAGTKHDTQTLRAAVHRKDVTAAEQAFAALSKTTPADAFNHLLHTVQDNTDVHRVVLPYRAWDLMGLIGVDHAHTLLRQSVRFCVRAESRTPNATWNEPRTLLPRLMEQHKLMGRELGTRTPDDAWVEAFSITLFKSTAVQAAEAAAAALAEGIAPGAVSEAVSLAANQLCLRDHGRKPSEEQAGKPVGSVHGDSIGVHACDSANAWRNMARVSNTRNTFACVILGAYQMALDRGARGGDFLNWQPLPVQWQLDQVKETKQEDLLRAAEEAIRQNLQSRTAAVIHRYGDLKLPARPVFDLMLRYAVSEDGALHAEKFYRTTAEEFAATRAAFRWRLLVALGRVTASEYGRPAPGMDEARALVKS